MLVWKVMFAVSTLQLGSDPPHFSAKINSAAAIIINITNVNIINSAAAIIINITNVNIINSDAAINIIIDINIITHFSSWALTLPTLPQRSTAPPPDKKQKKKRRNEVYLFYQPYMLNSDTKEIIPVLQFFCCPAFIIISS